MNAIIRTSAQELTALRSETSEIKFATIEKIKSNQFTRYDQSRKDRFWRESKETRNRFVRHLVEECRLDYNSLASHFGVPMQTVWKLVQKHGWRYNPNPRFFTRIG